ncbi:DUF3499 domain-containing protein [Gleimia hominis]|nr:DUF3499 domain-containing protein [Gleimia hominis]WIK64768.1 DUF3499 domain-containing protein [Gleimia hominis]
MSAMRVCSRPTCREAAVASLTYDYSEATAVLGPLPPNREPHAYELCEKHAHNFTAPRGWQVIRLETNFEPAPPSPDDLLALADAVREAGRKPAGNTPPGAGREPGRGDSAAKRRHHFRIVEGG